VLAASTAEGANETPVLVLVKVPATATPDGFLRTRVELAGSTALVKVAATLVLAATPVAPAAGLRVATTGAGETVLKLKVTGARTVPATLVAVILTE